jgi:cytochrome P450
MRLYPPVWLLTIRTSDEPLELNGYTIDPGSWIFVSPYVTHRDPRYFPDPSAFEPERFLGSRGQEIPRFAYIPFGAGPRVCIGNAFAMMEARLILAAIAQQYRLTLVPGQEIVPAPEITLSIRDGLRVKLEGRN